MKEADVQAAFEAYLLERGWDIQTDDGDTADVRAKRGAEVKGVTSSPGLDMDTGYGQLLRCMSRHPEATQFALVVPERLCSAVERVSPDIRRRLDLDVIVVDDLGGVRSVETGGSEGKA
ncbi:hypothetical protein GCM10009737_32470 [Nocardioides lentus]|uniref:Restriction endonuclease type IV Mrr domain-containing protein n=1 Tax=Nocardioides lentus TaxID=338077 RepID=A0ABN2PPG7_9ACTN